MSGIHGGMRAVGKLENIVHALLLKPLMDSNNLNKTIESKSLKLSGEYSTGSLAMDTILQLAMPCFFSR